MSSKILFRLMLVCSFLLISNHQCSPDNVGGQFEAAFSCIFPLTPHTFRTIFNISYPLCKPINITFGLLGSKMRRWGYQKMIL